MSVAGMSIRAGELHLAVVSEPAAATAIAQATIGGTSKLTFSDNLSGAAQLVDLKERIRQDLREWKVSSLHVLETSKHANWKYSSAVVRVLAISAAMYAAAEEDLAFSMMKPTAVAKLALSPKLDSIEPGLFGLGTRPTHWNAGLGQAYATAAAGLSAFQ
jgi:hypothetical protein